MGKSTRTASNASNGSKRTVSRNTSKVKSTKLLKQKLQAKDKQSMKNTAGKNGNKKQLSLQKLRKIKQRRPKKEHKVSLSKPENVMNLSRLRVLNKPAIKTPSPDENDVSPKTVNVDIDIDVVDKSESSPQQSMTMKMSNVPCTFKPGTTVELPQQIRTRHWKTVQHQHLSKLQEFNPKRAKSFAHSMFYKKEKQDMKKVEDELRDEIRADMQMERRRKKQRDELKKQNELRGQVVKPIRNMFKLKKFSKKQWKSVIKASVEIHNPRNAVRGTFIARQ
mmetsp:Transcript_18027/g.28500  ORF Transcript_18027/g.28500 Transcript_18027/m.28500 type:complete len:278 (+) Transcript_18027:39-872(+)|eukprot:CAMPEP_0202689962 /NCGR_PEP_ID=MMETSP1385-20130828/5120_1 /ASSEMBLY_ACC=CAM_ASM_000861 /TAXON_ID=933848 /ORGANISM="Elphidium margaritaceum" /LENGTH=277 /DNA_ID=CAMNT_0049345183 /DNA_START=35 /DNA_END=868 /DNA_ORIENTATION=+